jgi:hypothetical protein
MGEIKSERRRRLVTLVASLAIPLLTFGVAYTLFVPRPLSNDDLTLEMMARGICIADQPSPYLLFVNVWLGQVLAFLYVHLAGVPWYRVLMVGTHLAASMAVAAAALRDGPTLAKLVLLFAYFLAFDFHYYIWPQFTITATVAAEAGVVWWIGQTWDGRRLSPAALAVFLGLMILGASVRYESCALVFILAAPTVIACLWRLWRQMPTSRVARIRHLAWTGVFPFAAAALLMQAAKVYNDWCYRTNPEWSSFYEFNSLRAQFTDYERTKYEPETRWIFEEAGWSENDYRMLIRWFFANEEIYNVQKFRQILGHFPVLRDTRWDKVLGDLRFGLTDEPPLRMMLAASIVPFFFVDRRALGVLKTALATVVVLGILMVIYYGRLPPWVTWPVVGFPSYLALVLPARPRQRRPSGHPSYLLELGVMVLLALLAFDSLADSFKGSRSVRGQSAILKNALQKIDPQPNQLFVTLYWDMIPYDLILTGTDLEGMKPLKLLGCGYIMQSPVSAARLRSFGIDDLYRAIYERKDVFVSSDPVSNRLLIRYVREHYGKRIKSKCVFRTDFTPFRSMFMYQFYEAPPAPIV